MGWYHADAWAVIGAGAHCSQSEPLLSKGRVFQNSLDSRDPRYDAEGTNVVTLSKRLSPKGSERHSLLIPLPDLPRLKDFRTLVLVGPSCLFIAHR